MRVTLPLAWRDVLSGELEKPYFKKLRSYVDSERSEHAVYPPEEDVFNAFKLTALEHVSVLILGQDPYHGEGQAHGLAFSVRPGVRKPASLLNIFKELEADLGCPVPKSGYLAPWAEQGVLLLNAVLTVRAGQPNSHKGRGWETFTDEAIRAVNALAHPVVFVLWGAYAQKKRLLLDEDRHTLVTSAHPSPLSAKNGFFGSRPFSKVNAALRRAGQSEIDWCLPED